MSTLLTQRQKEIFEWICQSLKAAGYPPTLREISAHFHFSGTRAAEKHLLALEKKGLIRKGKGARAIEILGQTSGISLPILGRVAAGLPILAEENITGHLTLDTRLVKKPGSYLLEVKGNSMQGIGIMDGDYILVTPQPDAASGDIVIAMVDGEVTVKQLIKKKDFYILQPQNPAFRPIVVTKERDFQILGVSGGVIRIKR